jgi:dihydrofolate synthase/folylpolyglutamate synthase
MAPLVDAWHVCKLPTARAASADEIAAIVRDTVALARPGFDVSVTTHGDPAQALAAAAASSDPVDRIVVFGSFHTVGGVLKQGLPRLGGPHVG